MPLRLLRCAQVNLRHLVTRCSAGVVQTEADIEAAVFRGCNLQARIFKCRIGKAEPEREEWLYLLGIEPAITNKDSFGKRRFTFHTIGTTLRVRKVKRRFPKESLLVIAGSMPR